ncbi:hypothetical protein [Azospirillum sp. SYSU D00513]|uniref:hypothetical protein n=1 Tax=Azospirillum sp. SYSU D00513 TaxID=2812561 RepID=UPI001A96EB32|nr:hypothetical protein [Azospirillum sp. SYSU D00513]
MLARKKQTKSADMNGYLSPNVYEGKRPMSAAEAARRREGMEKRLQDLNEQQDTK